MIVSKQQMARLQVTADESFAREVIEHLRRTRPGLIASVPAGELRGRVLAALARARRHELSLKLNLITFVALALEISPAFDEAPPIRAVLTDRSIPVENRVARLFTEVTIQQWKEAARLARAGGA